MDPGAFAAVTEMVTAEGSAPEGTVSWKLPSVEATAPPEGPMLALEGPVNPLDEPPEEPPEELPDELPEELPDEVPDAPPPDEEELHRGRATARSMIAPSVEIDRRA